MTKIIQCIDSLEKKLLEHIQVGKTVTQACELEFPHFNDLNNISEKDVLLSAFEKDLPPQYYRENQFGYFNITLSQNDYFNIQLYIMNDIDTEVHDHGFTGAFKLLTGKTIHKTYTFDESKRLEQGITEGKCLEENTNKYSPGDFKIIDKKMIHQILRIEKVNITLIVTSFSKKSPNTQNGYYLPPHLSLKNLELTREFTRRLSALNVLFQKEKTIFKEQLQSFTRNSSLYELMTLLTRVNIYSLGITYEQDFQKACFEQAYEELKIRKLSYLFDDYKSFLLSQKKKVALVK